MNYKVTRTPIKNKSWYLIQKQVFSSFLLWDKIVYILKKSEKKILGEKKKWFSWAQEKAYQEHRKYNIRLLFSSCCVWEVCVPRTKYADHKSTPPQEITAMLRATGHWVRFITIALIPEPFKFSEVYFRTHGWRECNFFVQRSQATLSFKVSVINEE